MRTISLFLTAVLSICAVAPSAAVAQCGIGWIANTSTTGFNSSVRAFTNWDPDAAGPITPTLIAGGWFTAAGGQTARAVAFWNGSGWQPLGTNATSTSTTDVNALTSFGSDLIAAGSFQSLGGVTARNIARWNGSTWAPLGPGLTGLVSALVEFEGNLYAGGSISQAGTRFLENMARWNGTAWVSMPGFNNPVNALAVYNGALYAAGPFTISNGQTIRGIARWDGSLWQPVSGGLTGGTVHALVVHAGELIAGGEFTFAGSTAASRIARWNGTSWQTLGSGVNNTFGAVAVMSLASYRGWLIAGGVFNTAGGVSVLNIARWNGTSWHSMGGGVPGPDGNFNDPTVRALAPFGSALAIGGNFTLAGGLAAQNFSRWTLGLDPPIISQHPQPALLCPGASTQFSVVASSLDSHSYLWRRNGQPLSNGPSPSGSTIAGATSSTLSIAAIRPDDAGAYACLVSTACTNVLSNQASLSLNVCCIADVDDGSGTGAPDGGVTLDDLIYFLIIFADGHSSADIDNGSMAGVPDGGVTIDDLLYYLVRFSNGC